MIIRLRKNAQVTIPAAVVKQALLKEDTLLRCDYIDGCILLTPLQTIPFGEETDLTAAKGESPEKAARNLLPKPFFFCFGGFRLFSGSQIIYVKNQKARELLAYLLCEQGGPVKKSLVCENLWPDATPRRAMDCLYKVCRYLKILCRNVFIPLRIERNSIWLDLTLAASDLAEFMELYDRRYDISCCEKAVNLYVDSLFMEECFEWIARWESFYEIRYVEMLDILVRYYRETGPPTMMKHYLHLYEQFSE